VFHVNSHRRGLCPCSEVVKRWCPTFPGRSLALPSCPKYMRRSIFLSDVVVPRLVWNSKFPTASLHRRAMSTSNTDNSASVPLDTPKPKAVALTMQIIIRRDLLDVEKWPVGPLIAQGSHAATALMHLQRDSQAMKDYTEDWKHMRKVGCPVPAFGLGF
jgi:hypothetical protein